MKDGGGRQRETEKKGTEVKMSSRKRAIWYSLFISLLPFLIPSLPESFPPFFSPLASLPILCDYFKVYPLKRVYRPWLAVLWWMMKRELSEDIFRKCGICLFCAQCLFSPVLSYSFSSIPRSLLCVTVLRKHISRSTKILNFEWIQYVFSEIFTKNDKH